MMILINNLVWFIYKIPYLSGYFNCNWCYIKKRKALIMYYLNENIKNLYRIFDQNERKDYLRLDLNENPGGLPEDFIKDVLSNVDARLISEYPETLHFTEILANYLVLDL